MWNSILAKFASIFTGSRDKALVATSDFIDGSKSAAEHGDAEAQYMVGLWYATGQGVPQDDAEAVIWFRMAAEQGLARAQYELGAKYVNGVGVSQDYTEAAIWAHKAAEQGVPMHNICLV